MKTTRIFLAASVLLLTMLSSCKKAIDGYQNDPRLYFYMPVANTTTLSFSQSFSFATQSATTMADTLYVPVKIMGHTAGTDRVFGAQTVAAGTTAIANTDYKLLNGTVKAGQLTGLLPVLLYRTADLKTVTKQLNIKIADAFDFKGGVIENDLFTVTWNDTLIKPGNWDTLAGLSTYFGIYSAVKYQFIINVLGMSSFPVQGTSAYSPNLITNQQMLDYKLQLKTALALYNSTHAVPLTDEFGALVTFPN